MQPSSNRRNAVICTCIYIYIYIVICVSRHHCSSSSSSSSSYRRLTLLRSAREATVSAFVKKYRIFEKWPLRFRSFTTFMVLDTSAWPICGRSWMHRRRCENVVLRSAGSSAVHCTVQCETAVESRMVASLRFRLPSSQNTTCCVACTHQVLFVSVRGILTGSRNTKMRSETSASSAIVLLTSKG